MNFGTQVTLRVALLCTALVPLVAGCGNHVDLTESSEVQRSGILGQHFQTGSKFDLLKDKPSDTLRLVPASYPSYPRNYRVGEVEAGTMLTTDRVIRVTELAGFMVFPMYYTWDCTLAKIDTGKFAGKEIAVGGEGVELDQQTATIKNAHLVPTTKP